MQSITKHAIYIFLIIFALTALMCLGALGYLWYSSIANNSKTDLPYLSWLLGVVIAEVVGFVVVLAKKGVKFLPEVKMNETEDQTFKFMLDFINSGSSVVIVSNRVAWLNRSAHIVPAIVAMANKGRLIEIITIFKLLKQR